MTMLDRAALRRLAAECGFSHIGVIPAAPSPFLAAYERWIDAGMHGTMAYMARPDRVARRRDLNVILPGVQSILIAAVDYRTRLPEEALRDPRRGRIAAYAWSLDYHDRIAPRLEALASHLAALTDARQRVYVDTGAILERGHGYRAGLGFTGKNTMLIHPRRGSYFFLGEILTTAAFADYDAPATALSLCGTCTRCLSACPTDAFPQPYVLDARRCISYLTIEHKGSIDLALRLQMGNWIYGCDVCQDVCPWNRFTPLTPDADFAGPPALDRAAPPLRDLLALDEAGFRARFAGSPLIRTGWERVLRNACVAAGNSGDPDLVPLLRALRERATPLIAEHADWALERLT
jgi:epoxyqueuosine reductase